VVSDDREIDPFLVLVSDVGRDAVPQVDLAAGKVEILGVAVVRQDVAFETKPVAVVFWIPFATFGKIARLCNLVLWEESAPSSAAVEGLDRQLSWEGMHRTQCV
jgi:hypothetical protein